MCRWWFAVAVGAVASVSRAAEPPAPSVYTFALPDARLPDAPSPILTGTCRSSAGRTVGFNRSWFVRDGRPWLPVMGELHFSRVPAAEWGESLRKMKACGIEIVASYVFWNHHEETPGRWDWTGCRDLRAFAGECKRQGLLLWLRIGPWCHGEARHGGFPDDIQAGPKRCNDPRYLERVRRFFKQIAGQVGGLYFKDGGPVVGIQLENEFDFSGAEGYAHMQTLRRMAVEAGMDVPFYSATRWPAARAGQTEFLLGNGGYPEHPWDQQVGPMAPLDVFVPRRMKVDPSIGADLLGNRLPADEDSGSFMPLMTVELGGGNQVTWHRRPLIRELDCPAMALVALGSGANALGYYMFHGGVNPPGRTGPLQESRASGYPNDCPLVNYDFQAPIGSEGQLNPPYRHFKNLHQFVRDFGGDLCRLPSVLPAPAVRSPADADTLRCAIRGTRDHGYLFISNYQREIVTRDLPGVQFKLGGAPEAESFIPAAPVTIPADTLAIWPYNLDLNGTRLRYATATLWGRLGNEFVFVETPGVRPEFMLDDGPVAMGADGTARLPAATIRLLSPAVALDTYAQDGTLVRRPVPETAPVPVTSVQRIGRNAPDRLSEDPALTRLSRAAPKPLAGTAALWHPAQPAKCEFRASLALRRNPDSRYLLAFVADDHLALRVNGKAFASGGAWNRVGVWNLTPVLRTGENELLAELTNDNGPGGWAARLVEVRKDGSLADCLVTDPARWTVRAGASAPWVSAVVPAGFKTDWPLRAAAGGPRYGFRFTPLADAAHYAITLPPGIDRNSLLEIRYVGDTAGLYQDGQLINDDFQYGRPFLTRVARIPDPARPLVLQITPGATADEVFLQPEIRARVPADPTARLDSIRLLPPTTIP